MNKKFKPYFINSNIILKNFTYTNFSELISPVAYNTGNSYITYSLIKTLMGGLVDIDHIQNIYTYDFSKQAADIDYINNNCSHVFFILQDQIRANGESYGLQLPFDNIIKFLSKVNKPIIIAGLGANSFNGYDSSFHKYLNPQLVRFLNFLSSKSNVIGVRGAFTQEVLAKIGIDNTQIIGCPSYFETGANRIIKNLSNKRNILLTSNIHAKTKNLTTMLQSIEEETFANMPIFNRYNAGLTYNDYLKLFVKQFQIFINIENWKEFVSKFDVAIGYRLHGSILSINSGVPAICCNGDSRAREMCKFLHIPYYPNQNANITIDQLIEKINVDDINNSYPKLYENYKDFLHKNDLKLFDENPQDYEYIEQPTLNLYSKGFRRNLICGFVKSGLKQTYKKLSKTISVLIINRF